MKIVVFVASCDSVEYFYTLLSYVELPTQLVSRNNKKNKKKSVKAEGADDDGIGDKPNMERLLPCSLFKLHGSLSQDVRTSTFYAFSKAESAILFATDVGSLKNFEFKLSIAILLTRFLIVARGIDVPAIDWIVQYDVPSDPAAYIHRVRLALFGLKFLNLLNVFDRLVVLPDLTDMVMHC